MKKYKIERKTFETASKAWESWKDVSPEDRLWALEKLRKLAFTIQENGKQSTGKA